MGHCIDTIAVGRAMNYESPIVSSSHYRRNTAMRTLAFTLLLCSFANAADDGFTPLFNGKNLDGWVTHQEKPTPTELWSVKEGGILAAKDGWSWLATTKEYDNFVLKLEFRVPKDGNSGVFLRVPADTKKAPHEAGLEVQILDDEAEMYKGKLKPYQYSGSIYYFVPATKNVFKGAGEWNRYEITCQGDKVQIRYNGELVTDGDASKDPLFNMRPKKGVIGLQNHGSSIEFRNIELKPLN